MSKSVSLSIRFPLHLRLKTKTYLLIYTTGWSGGRNVSARAVKMQRQVILLQDDEAIINVVKLHGTVMHNVLVSLQSRFPPVFTDMSHTYSPSESRHNHTRHGDDTFNQSCKRNCAFFYKWKWEIPSESHQFNSHLTLHLWPYGMRYIIIWMTWWQVETSATQVCWEGEKKTHCIFRKHAAIFEKLSD